MCKRTLNVHKFTCTVEVRGVFVHEHIHAQEFSTTTHPISVDTALGLCTVSEKYMQAHLHTAYKHACQRGLASPATTSGH
jgi:hypothetical protein